jgi:hypothetical protein
MLTHPMNQFIHRMNDRLYFGPGSKLWIGMSARFPSGAHTGRRARRLENVPASG